MKVRSSAPGKSILMGEHAAVYGCPALVAAIDRRAVVEIEAIPGSKVRLDLPQVAVREEVTWRAILQATERARAAWQRYAADPSPEAFRRVRGDDPAHLVKIALGEAATHLGDGSPTHGTGPPGLALRLDSALPVGAGFGSSAAAAVAVVDAYLALRGTELPADQLHALTLEVERRQHGLPSGVDNATVIHGGLVWARKTAAGTMTTEPVVAHARWLGDLRLFHSGAPAESTGDVVAFVRRRRSSDPARFDPVIDRMERFTRELRGELEGEASPARTITALRGFEACLEELGVVPEPVREIVRQVERRGGGAKISGAGALSGRGAGSLLVYHPAGSAEIDRWGDVLGGLEALDLRLGAEGVRRE